MKAPLYASFGVREYWVIDARSLTTMVHRQLGSGGYGERSTANRDDTLVPLLVPALAVRLSDLDIE